MLQVLVLLCSFMKAEANLLIERQPQIYNFFQNW